MAKKRKVSRSTQKVKKGLYNPETYGIRLDSMTFLLFSVFVLVVAVWLVSNMIGFKMF